MLLNTSRVKHFGMYMLQDAWNILCFTTIETIPTSYQNLTSSWKKAGR